MELTLQTNKGISPISLLFDVEKKRIKRDGGISRGPSGELNRMLRTFTFFQMDDVQLGNLANRQSDQSIG